MKKNVNGIEILTEKGFVPFEGIAQMGTKQLYKLTFDDETEIEVTSKHCFFTEDGRDIQTRELSEGLVLLGKPNKTVVSIEKTRKEQTYDIIESKGNTFFANGLLSHNCEFLSSDKLLVDSMVLQNLTATVKAQKPLFEVKDVVFWKEPQPGYTYLVGVDPSSGSGEDYSVISIFEFPSMIQIAQYRSNTMSTNVVYGILKKTLKYLESKEATVFFSVENNGVGEGVIALFEADESPPETSEFVSEEGKERLGFTTTSKTKLKTCVSLKEMIESGKITISSSVLLAELKSFVRHSGSYAAQRGSTDDCISAVLVILRILDEMTSFDDRAFEKLYSIDGDAEFSDDDFDDYDENDAPLPMI